MTRVRYRRIAVLSLEARSVLEAFCASMASHTCCGRPHAWSAGVLQGCSGSDRRPRHQQERRKLVRPSLPRLGMSSAHCCANVNTCCSCCLRSCVCVRVISFDAPKRWKKELDEHVGVAGKAATGTGVPTVLLANKCDMLGDRAIPKEALDKVADESGFFKWFETSAKTGPLARSSLQFILHRALRFAAVRCAASLIGFNLPSDMFTRGVVHRSFA
jgi:hypothetical protein